MHSLRVTIVRSCISLVSILLVVAAPRCCLSQPAPKPIPSGPAGWRLDYTGSLYGYYRIEHGQAAQLTPVSDFLRDRYGSHYLLLGMGDNFAPEFGASIQVQNLGGPCSLPANVESPSGDPVTFPHALYKDRDRILTGKTYRRPVDCDNVANFLIRAGYRAIVPGREDFLYSADWLRDIALGLRQANDRNNLAATQSPLNPNADSKLNILAANLRFFSKGKDGSAPKDTTEQPQASKKTTTPRGADSFGANGVPCQLLFAPQSTAGGSLCTSTGLPTTTAVDWLQRIDASLEPGTGVAERIANETDTNTSRPSVAHAASILQLRRTLMENQARQLSSMTAAFDGFSSCKTPMTQIQGALRTLASDKSYKLNEYQSDKKALEGPDLDDSGGATSGKNAPNIIATQLTAMSSAPTPGTRPSCSSQVPTALFKDFLLFAQSLVGKFNNLPSERALLLDTLTREAGRRILLRAIAREQHEAGYIIASNPQPAPATSRTLIVGLVGQDTLNAVSLTNLKLGGQPTTRPGNGLAPDPQLPPDPADAAQGQVQALEPLPTLVAVLRAATQMRDDDSQYSFDRIVIMAQMPRSEAEELGSQLRSLLERRRRATDPDVSIPDLCKTPAIILSEAQSEEHSPNITLNYSACDAVPVLTPYPPYVGARSGALRTPWSEATLAPAESTTPAKTLSNIPPESPKDQMAVGAYTNLYLLLRAMFTLHIARPSSCDDAVNDPNDITKSFESSCQTDLTAELLAGLRHREATILGGDVVLLEQRDIFYGEMPDGYQDYSACPQDPRTRDFLDRTCPLRVALDRVFWKGDYQQRLIVAGSDLTQMLGTSQKQGQLDSTLSFTDASGQSLATFGIAQPESFNLSDPGSFGGQFPIPQDGSCGKATDSTADVASFCVNGQPIQSDASYWVVTSDHLAQDSVLYKSLAAHKSDDYQEKSKDPAFLTASIAENLMHSSRPPAPNAGPNAEEAEWAHQQRYLIHLDISKLVAGFTAREPQGGNMNAQNFQGSTDARASTPSQQELDLESLTRWSLDLPLRPGAKIAKAQQLTASVGIQEDAEYDRTATGNLTDKPTTVVQALNNFTVGPFAQMRLPQWRGPHGNSWLNSGRALPRTLLVISPFQYSRQLTGTFLFFPFTQSPPPPAIAGEYTFQAPFVSSFFQKAGIRHEDSPKDWLHLSQGSYIEVGFEFGVQHDVLSSLSLATPDAPLATPLTCNALNSVTIAACFSGYANTKSSTYQKGFVLDPLTYAAAFATRKLHTEGGYWDIHLQEKLGKSKPADAATAASPAPGGKSDINTFVSLTFDSKGDWFSPRSALHSLNTQTHFDIPLALAINFPVLRNFSLSPTLSAFRYGSQITGERIQINTFSIQAKWYFARDASVPVVRQAAFVGPASADQTSTAKMK